MSESVLVGIDVGTQGVKAAVYDLHGRCLAEAHRKSQLLRPAAGVVEEDPEFQLRCVCEVMAECAAAAAVASGKRRVAGIAIDGQMAGILGVDESGRHVTPYDSWLDTRCASYIERMRREAGSRIVELAGGPPSINHGPKILWWKHERPEIYARIRAFVQPAGYAAMRLCGLTGEQAFVDITYLHFCGFADSRGEAWDRDLCARFGVDPGKLPRIVQPNEVVGELAPEAAALCGLEPGVPVVAGCGDTAASFLSCGAVSAGVCVDVAGTACVFAGTETEFRPDCEQGVLSCAHSATPGLWHPYAYINGGGLNLEWLRATILAPLASGGSCSLEELNRLAAEVEPRADDPIFVPHLGGRVSPGRPRLRGCWAGLAWDHGLGHLFRAALEGVALEYGIYLRRLEALYGAGRVREIRVTGGGERNAVWNRIKADILGVPVVQIQGGGGAPLGSALLAGHGVGLFPDLAEAAREWIKTGTVTEPDPARSALARARLDRYILLLEAMERWSGEGEEER